MDKNTLNSPFILKELELVFVSFPNCKAQGVDGLPNEIYKWGLCSFCPIMPFKWSFLLRFAPSFHDWGNYSGNTQIRQGPITSRILQANIIT